MRGNDRFDGNANFAFAKNFTEIILQRFTTTQKKENRDVSRITDTGERDQILLYPLPVSGYVPESALRIIFNRCITQRGTRRR